MTSDLITAPLSEATDALLEAADRDPRGLLIRRGMTRIRHIKLIVATHRDDGTISVPYYECLTIKLDRAAHLLTQEEAAWAAETDAFTAARRAA